MNANPAVEILNKQQVEQLEGNFSSHIPNGKLIALEGLDGSGKSTALATLYHSLEEENIYLSTEPDDNTIYGQAVRDAIKDEKTDPLAVFFLFLADHANHYFNTIQPKIEENKTIICDRYIDSRYAYQSHSLKDTINQTQTHLKNLKEYIYSTNYPNIKFTQEVSDAPPETLFFITLARAFTDNNNLHPKIQPGKAIINIQDKLYEKDSELTYLSENPTKVITPMLQVETPLEWIKHIQEYGSWSQIPDKTILLDIQVQTTFERKKDDKKERFEKREFLETIKKNYESMAAVESRFSKVDGEQAPIAVANAVLNEIVNSR